MKKDWLMIVLIILIIAGGVFYKKRLNNNLAQSPETVSHEVPAPVKAPELSPSPVANETTSAAAVAVSESQSSASPEIVQAITEKIESAQKFFCQYFEANQTFPVPHTLLLPILKKEVQQLILPKEVSSCLLGKQQITLAFVRLNENPYFAFSVVQNVSISLNGTRSVDAMEGVTDEVLLGTDKVKHRGRIRSLMSPFFSSQTGTGAVDVISFQLNSVPKKKLYYLNPPTHPLATNVNAAEAENFLKEGAVLVDTRLKDERKSGGDVEGAFLLSGVKELKTKLLSGNEIEARGLALYPTEKIKDKNVKIIVAGKNQLDLTAYNVITFLHKNGYSKLYYLRGGIDELKGQPLRLPTTTLKSTKIIDYEGLLQEMGAAASVIDVRLNMEFSKDTIPGSISTPYIERVDEQGYPLMKDIDSVTAGKLLEGDYAFPQISADPNKAVVLFGKHELDLAPYKVAKILESRGYAKILIFDGGWKAWEFGEKIDNPDKRRASRAARVQRSRERSKQASELGGASSDEKKSGRGDARSRRENARLRRANENREMRSKAPLARSENNKMKRLVDPKRLDSNGNLKPKTVDPVRAYNNGKRVRQNKE